jgi:hypothetical protein
MLIRDLIAVVALLASVVLTATIGPALGSEYFLFIPARRYHRWHDIPTHPVVVLAIFSIIVGSFFLSRRFAAIFLTGVSVLFAASLPMAILVFEWSPGIAQYVLIITSAALTIYVWTHEELHED